MGIVIKAFCRKCGNGCRKSTKIIDGQTVVRCLQCDELWFEGDYVRIHADLDDVKARLLARLNELERNKQMMESESSDPRWTNIGFDA